MTKSYAIDHVVATLEDVSVEVAAKSELTLISTDTDPKTGKVTSTFTLASGDRAFPGLVVYTVSTITPANGPVRRINVTFSTWATETDSVTGEIVRKAIKSSFQMDVPADFTVELADAMQLVGNTFSFLYPSVTTKVRSTLWLQDLLFGAPEVA
jgi:hypothetical protein